MTCHLIESSASTKTHKAYCGVIVQNKHLAAHALVIEGTDCLPCSIQCERYFDLVLTRARNHIKMLERELHDH